MNFIKLCTIKMSIGCMFAVISCSNSENNNRVAPVKDKQVFICTSNSALRYHLDRSCPGLAKCKHTIIATTLITAQKRGRTMCGWE